MPKNFYALQLALQLDPYEDSSVVQVARREMAEAYQLDDRMIDTAAYTLTDPRYLMREHMGLDYLFILFIQNVKELFTIFIFLGLEHGELSDINRLVFAFFGV
jgi:hypothetical protein